MDIRLDKHETEPKSWAKGNPSPEPRAQGSGKGRPPEPPHGVRFQGFERVRGFWVEVRTDHLLIIDRPGRSQGRTLSSVVCGVLYVCTYVGTVEPDQIYYQRAEPTRADPSDRTCHSR